MTSYVGDTADKCKLALFCDASFAGDLKDSKSTSGVILCIVGPHTFCFISWIVKKQGAVSHSSSEAEIISLEAGTRMEGLPVLNLWDKVTDIFHPTLQAHREMLPDTCYPPDIQTLLDSDNVRQTVHDKREASMVILDANDAVIKMCVKGRSPNMRHVARTHRIDLDWLFERLLKDSAITMSYINTKQQLADMFTKGSFTEVTWKTLLTLVQIGQQK